MYGITTSTLGFWFPRFQWVTAHVMEQLQRRTSQDPGMCDM